MFKQLLVEENPQKERSWIELWKRCSKFWILKFDEALLLGWWEAGISGMMFKKCQDWLQCYSVNPNFKPTGFMGRTRRSCGELCQFASHFHKNPAENLRFFPTLEENIPEKHPKQPVFFFIAQLAKICWSLQIVFQGTAGITTLVLFMVQKSHSQPPFGCIKPHK